MVHIAQLWETLEEAARGAGLKVCVDSDKRCASIRQVEVHFEDLKIWKDIPGSVPVLLDVLRYIGWRIDFFGAIAFFGEIAPEATLRAAVGPADGSIVFVFDCKASEAINHLNYAGPLA